MEKATPGFSGPVVGSVSYVLGLDAVVLVDVECHLVTWACTCLLVTCQCHV